MSMDAWKKVYCNEDTETIAIPYFWENLDKEGYSIWFAEYKYNTELARMFMTANLIKGMFQRLEKIQKTCFGNILVFGKDNDAAIAGLWVLRGQQLVFDVSLEP